MYWVDEFDIDGFRLDVAWGPAERAPDFWPKAVRAVRAGKRVFLLAEASVTDLNYSGFLLTISGIPCISEGDEVGAVEEVEDERDVSVGLLEHYCAIRPLWATRLIQNWTSPSSTA